MMFRKIGVFGGRLLWTCLAFFVAVMVLYGCKKEPANPVSNWQGTGLAVFTDYEPLAHKPVRLFYHVPTTANQNSPIVLVFHGAERNALEYRNALVNKADAWGFILVVPEFSEQHFPEVNAYQLGDVYADGDAPSAATLRDESAWSFSLVEPIFAYVRNQTKNTNQVYWAIGHSGGAQFLHRFLLFKPGHKCARAIVSAAGWYTATDAQVDFPYGLRSSPLETRPLAPLFTQEVVVQVGSADNNPNASSLRRTPEADLQGLHRRARAEYFYETASQAAQALGVPFHWQLDVVPGLSHDYVAAVNHAANQLFPLGLH